MPSAMTNNALLSIDSPCSSESLMTQGSRIDGRLYMTRPRSSASPGYALAAPRDSRRISQPMGMDLRDLLRADLRVHPRLVQQGLFARVDVRQRIAAAIPPLIPFADAQYAGGSGSSTGTTAFRRATRCCACTRITRRTPARARGRARRAQSREISGRGSVPRVRRVGLRRLSRRRGVRSGDRSRRAARRGCGWSASGGVRFSPPRRRAPSTSSGPRRRSGSCAARAGSAPPGSATSSRPSGRRHARADTCAGRWTSGTC